MEGGHLHGVDESLADFRPVYIRCLDRSHRHQSCIVVPAKLRAHAMTPDSGAAAKSTIALLPDEPRIGAWR